MGMQQENWDEEWAGLEPKQGRWQGWGCWLGGTALLVILLLLCGLGGYFAWQRLDLTLGPGLVLVPPTALGGTAIPAETEEPQATTAEPLALAPTVTLPAGQAVERIEVTQVSAAPAIDGSLEDWTIPVTAESNHLVYSVDGWDRSDDVLAQWYLAWDSANLYLAAQVTDDRHVQTQSGDQIFRGDGVSLQIDSDLDGDYGPGLNVDDYQINLSPGDFASTGPSAFRFQGTSSGGSTGAPGHEIRVAARQTAGGYLLEAAVPWADLGLTPSTGLELGLALNVNDNDTPGTAVQEVMKSSAAARTFEDPRSWGRLVLR
jgi:hypothetical protein